MTLWCAICGCPEAELTVKPLNGLPVGVMACRACREAVRRREVGVTVRPDGQLSITDGREAA